MNRVLILRSGWDYKPIPQELIYEAYADDIRFMRLYAFREKFQSSVPVRTAVLRVDGDLDGDGSQSWKPRLRAQAERARRVRGSEPVVLRPMPSLAQEHLWRQYMRDRQRLQEVVREVEEDESSGGEEEQVENRPPLWRVFDCSPSVW